MSKIDLLKHDGTIEIIDEKRLTYNKLNETKYLLIKSTAQENDMTRSCIMVNSSSLFIFDKAIIEYQIGVSYDNFDDNEMYCDCELNPVYVETDSIADLVNLMNSIDKINIPNNLMNESMFDGTMEFSILYIGVILYKNNIKIYDKYFMKKESSTTEYHSWVIAKIFDDIYQGNITNEFQLEKQYILISIVPSCFSKSIFDILFLL